MADSGTLATTAQVLLSIGENASINQVLEANTNIWILYAESEIENQFGNKIGIVANYAGVTAANKQWLAKVAADRAAWHGINQDQSNWSLSVTQSKLNILDATWSGFLSDLKERKADIIADLGF